MSRPPSERPGPPLGYLAGVTFLTLFALAACREAGPEPDTAAERHCELSEPWPIQNADDVGFAAEVGSPSLGYLLLYEPRVSNALLNLEELADCSDRTDLDGVVTLTAACETENFEISGTAVFDGSAEDLYTATYTTFHFVDLSGETGMAYDADGTWSQATTETTTDWVWDLSLALAGSDLDYNVEATYDVTLAEDLDSADWDGYVQVQSQSMSSATGDFCWQCTLLGDLQAYEYTSDTTRIFGGADGTIHWDLTGGFHECGDVTIGGADAGRYCGP